MLSTCSHGVKVLTKWFEHPGRDGMKEKPNEVVFFKGALFRVV